MFSAFLRRPALAIVISIIILFLGGLSIKTLPISQFPNVAPPSVVVTLAFPMPAQVLVDSVLVILEQAINGVQDMRYMVSAGTSAGEATILIVFEPGTDPNVAVLNVQNRVQTVKQRLPPIVELEGIIVLQQMTSMLMYVNIYSTDPKHDQDFLYNYVCQHRARDQAGAWDRCRQYSRQPRVLDAGVAESGAHAGLQCGHRRRDEGTA